MSNDKPMERTSPLTVEEIKRVWKQEALTRAFPNADALVLLAHIADLERQIAVIAETTAAISEARKAKDIRLAQLEEQIKQAVREDAHQQMSQ